MTTLLKDFRTWVIWTNARAAEVEKAEDDDAFDAAGEALAAALDRGEELAARAMKEAGREALAIAAAVQLVKQGGVAPCHLLENGGTGSMADVLLAAVKASPRVTRALTA